VDLDFLVSGRIPDEIRESLFFYGGERILGVILGYCKDYCRLYIYKRRRDFLLTQEVASERVKPEQKGGC